MKLSNRQLTSISKALSLIANSTKVKKEKSGLARTVHFRYWARILTYVFWGEHKYAHSTRWKRNFVKDLSYLSRSLAIFCAY
jgi:hypothetical protein